MTVFKGFTLSEVLITVGVLGVIAALTMPNFITNYQQKSYASTESLFINRMTSAINGLYNTGHLEGNQTTEDFVKELQKFMQISKVCENTNIKSCFVSEIKYEDNDNVYDTSKLLYSSNLGNASYGTNTVGLQFNFGVSAIIAYNKNCTISSKIGDVGITCVSILYDLNGKNLPNQLAKDVRLINASINEDASGGSEEPEAPPTPPPTSSFKINCVNRADWDLCKASSFTAAASDSSMTGAGTNGLGWGMNRDTAKAACESAGLRLPTVNEAVSMSEAARAGQIPGFQSGGYWTSSRSNMGSSYAANVNMQGGNWGSESISSTDRRVRCVK